MAALTEAAARGETAISIIDPQQHSSSISANSEEHNIISAITTDETVGDKDEPMKNAINEEIEFEEDPQNPIESDVTDKGKNLRFKCDDCNRPYVTKAALKKHLQLVHNKELDASLQK